MKKWQIVVIVVTVLTLLLAAPLAALAQEESATDSAASNFKGALALVAPRVVAVGKEMSMGVFLRVNQEPVAGVGIWALTRDRAESLKTEMEQSRQSNNASVVEKDYEAMFNASGTFLGRTGENGKLTHTFNEAGNYVLVAFLRGYYPGFSALSVGQIPNALAIKAPKRASPGESVTIAVFQRGTQEPVKDAGVWALTRENAETLKAKVAEIREANKAALAETDWEPELNIHGTFLGRTNGNGELKHTFNEEGIYVLVTIKRGYLPGWTGIAIKDLPQALAIRSPGKALVGESVTLGVFERGTGEPVKDAGIWAVTGTDVESVKAEAAQFKDANKDNLLNADWESFLNAHAIFLGTTHGNGELKYTFNDEGRYLLITFKKGYIPGFGGIAIISQEVIEQPNTQTTK